MAKLVPMIAVGQVVKRIIWEETPLVKVKLQKMKLDNNLLMYFPKLDSKWAIETTDETKPGDIVVVRNLDEKYKGKVTCKVHDILYKAGAVKDPVTGRLCRGTEYIDEAERKVEQSKRTDSAIKLQTLIEKEGE